MQTAKLGRKMSCGDYRFLANKCYYMEEDEFIDLLLAKHEEKKKYADFLEKEGSIMAKSFRDKENVFRLKDTSPGGQMSPN